jgi:hypothetical protein
MENGSFHRKLLCTTTVVRVVAQGSLLQGSFVGREKIAGARSRARKVVEACFAHFMHMIWGF